MRHIAFPLRTFAGVSALDALEAEITRSGAGRVLVVCNASVARIDVVRDLVRDRLGERLVGVWSGVQAHSPLQSVIDARDALISARADGVVIIGGGSAIVTARAAVILLGEGLSIHDICTYRDESGRLRSPRLESAKIPQWIIPTTPTTAVATAGCAVLDPQQGDRLAVFDPKARARAIFLEPVLLNTAPAALVTAASLNTFAMSIEGLLSAGEDPIADAALVHALSLVVEWLPQLEGQQGSMAREQLAMAGHLCSQASEFVGGGIAQALAHSIGLQQGVPNGISECILLPHTLQLLRESLPARNVRRVIAAVASESSAGDLAVTLVDVVESFLLSINAPRRFSALGIENVAWATVANHAFEDWALTGAARSVSLDELESLLEAAR